MAGPDPRRSSRARPLQSQSQHSSTTSSNSGRLERSTRSLNRNASPQKSTPTASLSSEPPEESIATTDDIPTRSRRTRAKDEEAHPSPIISEIEMAHGGDDIQEDDEAVRCVCGDDEYPGPPSSEDLKHASKDGLDLESATFPTEITDDLAGFFVQCDICKVWQHGACVGLANDETLPEEYFCEECKKELHRVFTRSNGPPFSIYLPLARGSRAVSVIKEGTRSPKEREKRGDAASQSYSSKRRSTMNSRDAAYEEEQLRRAIEASKKTMGDDSVDGSTRRPKRGRDESEEKQETSKRPRTTSRSPSPSADKQLAGDDSDDALATRNGGSKKSRAQANARTQQLKSEREEKERARAEQANKRKGGAERRRADDSDPSEELPLAARTKPDRPTPAAIESIPTIEPPPSSQPSPDTPSASHVPGPSSKSKSSRPSHKKKGRNQYTKDDREGGDSPARSQSRDVHETHIASRSGATETSKSHHKGKGSASRSPTMGEMKRKAQAMLDFITKTQLELVHENNPARFGVMSTLPAIKLNGDASATKKSDNRTGGASPLVNGDSGATNGVDVTDQKKNKEPEEKTFESLSVVEKMDKLTKDIIHWQNEFGS